MVKVLVTGAAGFAAGHLVPHLTRSGYEVACTDREAGCMPGCVPCDITDESAVDNLLEDIRPDAVVNLAAVSFVQDADSFPQIALNVNLTGAHNLIESTLKHAPDATFLAISSAAVYGNVLPEDQPIRETAPPAPANVYASTKAALETLCTKYTGKLRIILLRPFNHIGPGQAPSFVAGSFARQIATIEAGRAKPVIRAGNLDARRDFTDVRDVAMAYRLALERCEPDTPYNICSGRYCTIRHLLDTLLSMTDADISVETDDSKLRADEISMLLGCPDKFVKTTGWKRSFHLVQSLSDVLGYWRDQIREA